MQKASEAAGLSPALTLRLRHGAQPIHTLPPASNLLTNSTSSLLRHKRK